MADIVLAARALALLDLTDLSEDSSEAGARELCARARSGPVPVAAVCLWPRWIGAAKAALAGSPVRIATVVNFPSGGGAPDVVAAEIAAALAAGADEIDLVLPWRAFLAGDAAPARAMVTSAKRQCGDRLLKVILESGEYPDRARVTDAAELAVAAGADFIKTSTGKTARSASPEAARAMLDVIARAGRPVGLKPSGGIRTLADAGLYLSLADEIMGPGWAAPATFRFGASGLHGVLAAELAGTADGAAAAGHGY